MLVRDPVERAYSQHAHELARGFETERDFERALALEPARLAGEAERMIADPAYYSFTHQHHAYLARGEYVEHLRRLAQLFGRDRHARGGQPSGSSPTRSRCYDEVLDFLGLPPAGLSGVRAAQRPARGSGHADARRAASSASTSRRTTSAVRLARARCCRGIAVTATRARDAAREPARAPHAAARRGPGRRWLNLAGAVVAAARRVSA